jgi:hypothetical protein
VCSSDLVIGSGGTLDMSQAVSSVAVDGITVEEGYTLNNPFDKITRPYTITFRGELSNGTIDIGTGRSVTVN